MVAPITLPHLNRNIHCSEQYEEDRDLAMKIERTHHHQMKMGSKRSYMKRWKLQ